MSWLGMFDCYLALGCKRYCYRLRYRVLIESADTILHMRDLTVESLGKLDCRSILRSFFLFQRSFSHAHFSFFTLFVLIVTSLL